MTKAGESERGRPKPKEAAGSAAKGHENHCFVVMPFGRDAEETRWFRGWYEVVIRPAVVEAGYVPILASSEEQPGAINDEIRAHLALDEMVVVDLGGAKPADDPNPNVMYELGIRHALGLPLVILAWKGQRLPFDVSNQRVIMENRELVDLEQNRTKLATFIAAAREGRYYRPMDAVSRLATIQAATTSLGEDSLLRALIQEITALKASITNRTLKQEEFPRNDALIFTEFVTHSYWNAFSRASGRSLDELFSILKEAVTFDDFIIQSFPNEERRRTFVKALVQGDGQKQLLENANVIRGMLKVPPYTALTPLE